MIPKKFYFKTCTKRKRGYCKPILVKEVLVNLEDKISHKSTPYMVHEKFMNTYKRKSINLFSPRNLPDFLNENKFKRFRLKLICLIILSE